MSAKKSYKTGQPYIASDSHTKNSKLSSYKKNHKYHNRFLHTSEDSYEENDYGIGDNNGMEYEEDISNLANGSKNSLGSKSKRRNTSIVNHSMQTDMLRGGNISVQTEVVQRRSHWTEVF